MTDTNTHLDRFRGSARARLPVPDADPATDDEYTAFAFGRAGTRPQLMLVLRDKVGLRRAFAYTHLYDLAYDPDVGISLTFTKHTVRLTGRNLDTLFHYLTTHRASVVQETDAVHALVLPADAAVVTGLTVVAARDAELV